MRRPRALHYNPLVPRCPECGSEADLSFSSCPACSAPLPWNADVTRLADASASTSSKRRPSNITSSSGWLGTSDIDHGRFAPGTIFDERYRIIGRLGRGGMGEVYRADDLKLGQPVALKFLPPDVDTNPERLSQLHSEVRMARQVSHPNVCRVYDVGEFDGHTFLSMEYVDGEDLASLLRRIGRFPEDRAIELARQICAGLAAAHDRGVVHRDLKPANIMLDGNGRIRITDFGLAGASGETLRAGTPAYMAPEQLAGQEVTPRSDIYALGLVLYELFTGRRALDARNVAELVSKQEHAAITPPSAIVSDLDPAVERIILRCIDVDVQHRPASAIAVAAALPGGDPLAAALAAGETPSPEMVAAAGTSAALSVRAAVLAITGIAASLLVLMFVYQRVLLVNRTPMPKTPEALVDRAQEIVTKLGYGAGVQSSAAGLSLSANWLRFIAATKTDRDRWTLLNAARPESIVLWYRTSPAPLIPLGSDTPTTGLNPPLNVSGMTLAVVDMEGRLSEFHAVPQPTLDTSASPKPPTDWSPLFDAAGLSMRDFTPVPPLWTPISFADERAAWEGRLPERPDYTVRIEAAALQGHPMSFALTGPWTRSARSAPPAQSRFNVIVGMLAALIMPALMLAGVVLARVNVTRGRGDRRGAFRAAAAMFFMMLAVWALGDHHVPTLQGELGRFFDALAEALFGAATLWVTYLGLEPYVRRFSPDSLIGWARLVAGGWRDVRVGRDTLIGVGAGLAATLAYSIHNLLPLAAGRPEPMPVAMDPGLLMALRYSVATVLDRSRDALSSAMLGVVGYTALYIFLKRRILAMVAAIVIFLPVAVNGMFMPGTPLLDLAVGLCIITIFVWVIAYAGLLASVAMLVTHFVLLRAPLTTDLSSWRAAHGLVFVAAIGALGVVAALTANGRFVRGNSQTANSQLLNDRSLRSR